VNKSHLQFLGSPDWAAMLQAELVPWLDSTGALGDDLLEIGPGPGLTTDILRTRVQRLTAVETDEDLAAALAERLADTNVTVLHGDAAVMPYAADRFSAATSFAVLHHIPTPEHQDAVFAELGRVLRPGAHWLGTDSVDTPLIRGGHVDDTFVPIDPDTFEQRLARAGFVDVVITQQGEHQLRFTATKAG
jgi:SAM-dependent methyltransferase